MCASLLTLQFEKSAVDQLTEKHQLPVTRFGIEWMGLSVTPLSSSVCRIDLLGMKGPFNFFTIFLPKKALQEPERSRKGMDVLAYVCVCVCVRCITISGLTSNVLFMGRTLALRVFLPNECACNIALWMTLHFKFVGF